MHSKHRKGGVAARIFLVVFVLGLVFSSSLQAQTHLQKGLEKFWVYFKDKGELAKRADVERLARATLSPRSVQRRLLRGSGYPLFDQTDLPVNGAYIQKLEAAGFQVWNRSRWLNAVSVFAHADQVPQLRKFSFVKKVVPVRTWVRPPLPKNGAPKMREALEKENGAHSLHYGDSYDQNALIHVPELHDLGLSGKGVLVGMLDTGFRWRTHEAFKSLKVLAEYDFIHHDSITANQAKDSLYFPDKPGQDSHGTETLSTIAGFAPNFLIGPAYGATFVLAKTEYVPSETRIEEDNWVAGIEWEDSLGVDVVSSSLGYLDFEDGFTYDPKKDLDGKTAVTTIAAELAVKKGIVVVNSMGNEYHSRPTTLLTPADGDSVIAVGAVTMTGELAAFSSDGPTSDGRIKPDVCAPGVSVTVASPYTEDGFTHSSGTSFSCPLTAGVAALLLEAYPTLKPIQLRDALRNTASQAKEPDNYMGWGIVNAYEAYLYGKEVISGFNGSVIPKLLELSDAYPNPAEGIASFRYGLPQNLPVRVTVYNVLGQIVAQLELGQKLAGVNHLFSWNGLMADGRLAPSGIYFCVLKAGPLRSVKRFVFLQK